MKISFYRLGNSLPDESPLPIQKYLAAAALLLISGGAFAQQDAPKTEAEKKAYLLGYNIGAQFRGQMLTPDMNTLFKGILDGIQGNKPKIPDDQLQAVMKAIQQEIAANHMRAGEAFLAKNRSKQGIKTTASGLQFETLKQGTGKTPSMKDNVTVHYQAMYIDGSAFDSSYARKEPSIVPVAGVIKGWTEALLMMKEGDKLRLYIKTELAFGESPPPEMPIPPNAALIYDLELLKVNPPAPKK